MTPERADRIKHVVENRQSNLAVVMENVHDAHNIAAVMRTCDAVGIQDIYILNSKILPHNYFGIKSSSSAAKWLTVHSFTDTASCFKVLREKYDFIYSTYLGDDSIGLYEIDFTQRVALVFGNEHDGVTEDARSLCNGNFVIPQVGMIQSLNISVACAISIYEAFRQKKNDGHYSSDNTTHPEVFKSRSPWGRQKN